MQRKQGGEIEHTKDNCTAPPVGKRSVDCSWGAAKASALSRCLHTKASRCGSILRAPAVATQWHVWLWRRHDGISKKAWVIYYDVVGVPKRSRQAWILYHIYSAFWPGGVGKQVDEGYA